MYTFYSIWKVMPSKHLTEYNTFRGDALHFTRKPNTNQYTETLVRRRARGGTGSGVLESPPAGLCVFLSDPDPDPESKIWEKMVPDPGSLLNFGSSRSLCGQYFIKNMGKLRSD